MLKSALDFFLRELLDDAGLFPPTSISMEEALAGRIAALRSPQRWMAGRFIVPASRLNELSGSAELLRQIAELSGRPLQVGVVSDCPDPRADYAATGAYLRSGDRSLNIRSLEVRIPRAAPVGGAARVQSVLQKFGDADLPQELAVFIEAPYDATAIVADTLDAIAAQRASGRDNLHAKLRCAAADLEAVPAAEDIAFFISHARMRMVPFKLTAGLHTPLRGIDPITGIASHGLLNVMGAAVLAFGCDADLSVLTQIVHDDRPEHFRLDDRRFSWKEYTAEAATVFNARITFVRSVGSCSFREPIEGLRRLGILPNDP